MAVDIKKIEEAAKRYRQSQEIEDKKPETNIIEKTNSTRKDNYELYEKIYEKTGNKELYDKLVENEKSFWKEIDELYATLNLKKEPE